jgi:hypothetical protein
MGRLCPRHSRNCVLSCCVPLVHRSWPIPIASDSGDLLCLGKRPLIPFRSCRRGSDQRQRLISGERRGVSNRLDPVPLHAGLRARIPVLPGLAGFLCAPSIGGQSCRDRTTILTLQKHSFWDRCDSAGRGPLLFTRPGAHAVSTRHSRSHNFCAQ